MNNNTENKNNETKEIKNFIRNIIEKDLAEHKFQNRRWCGQPDFAEQQNAADLDAAKIRTRFPPEPNGFLHLGHAKSILLNFGLANDFGGVCHLRFDDTNPEKEDDIYVRSIKESVKWLGGNWHNNEYFASNYFEKMLTCAEYLIKNNLAYVDSQTAEEMRKNRGTLTEVGKNSPFRDRSVEENLQLFADMKAGKFADGQHVLRAKIDMASPNINLRDPAIYRIRHATHHNTGDRYCVYPMYTFAHPIEDALECITHSICTLEFEDQRPFYDWLLEHLAAGGLLQTPLPKQYEFSRLNLSHVVLSKRKLIQLVSEKHVEGWDDPRLPTLAGAKRRGYSPEGIKLFIDRIGVSKSDSLINYSIFEDCQREVLNESSPRKIAVLSPLKLIIQNFHENEENFSENCTVANHPQKSEFGERTLPLTKEIWIESDDFMETPSKGFRRLFVGNKVRLKYAYIIECTGFDKDPQTGKITAVYANYFPETKSGTAGADSIKVKGNIHWLSVKTAVKAQINLYDRLFNTEIPGDDFISQINPNAKQSITAFVEPSEFSENICYQFERHGYFVLDQNQNQNQNQNTQKELVFNRTVTLKDNWNNKKPK